MRSCEARRHARRHVGCHVACNLVYRLLTVVETPRAPNQVALRGELGLEAAAEALSNDDVGYSTIGDLREMCNTDEDDRTACVSIIHELLRPHQLVALTLHLFPCGPKI